MVSYGRIAFSVNYCHLTSSVGWHISCACGMDETDGRTMATDGGESAHERSRRHGTI
jgi:hypothetical protein